jgi:hypothetical protein
LNVKPACTLKTNGNISNPEDSSRSGIARFATWGRHLYRRQYKIKLDETARDLWKISQL